MPSTAPLWLAKAADAMYRALYNDDRLAALFQVRHSCLSRDNMLRQFLSGTFGADEEQWPSAIDTEAVKAASKDLIEVVLEAIATFGFGIPPGQDTLNFAMQLVCTEFAEDPRVHAFFEAVRAAAREEDQVHDEMAAVHDEGDQVHDEMAAVRTFDYVAYTHSASLVARAGPLQLPMVPPARESCSSEHASDPLTTSHAELRCPGCNDVLVVVAPGCGTGAFNANCECDNMEHHIDIIDWSVDGYVKIWHKQYLIYGPMSRRQRTV
jgi:hypothetical protein